MKVSDHRIFYKVASPKSEYDTSDIPIWKLYIPKSLTQSLIKNTHCQPSTAHLGFRKTLEVLQRIYYWPSMVQDVHAFVTTCETCKECKPVNATARPPMGAFTVIQRQWQKLYIDFLGPYPRSRNGNCFLFIIMDHFSRFILLEPMRVANSENVCTFLEQRVFNVFSVPEIIVSDNGKQFVSKRFSELMGRYGVKHQLTPKYHPQSNACERVNRSILSAIRSYIKGNHLDWDKNIHFIASALRNTIHSSTDKSPYFLVFGQQFISHGHDYELLKKLRSLDDRNLELANAERLNIAQQSVLKHLRFAYEQNVKNYNLRSREKQFNIGQTIFVRNFVQSEAINKLSAKLYPKFKKAVIVNRIGNVAYEVQDLNGKNLGVYHAKDIRT